MRGPACLPGRRSEFNALGSAHEPLRGQGHGLRPPSGTEQQPKQPLCRRQSGRGQAGSLSSRVFNKPRRSIVATRICLDQHDAHGTAYQRGHDWPLPVRNRIGGGCVLVNTRHIWLHKGRCIERPRAMAPFPWQDSHTAVRLHHGLRCHRVSRQCLLPRYWGTCLGVERVRPLAFTDQAQEVASTCLLAGCENSA